MPGSSRASATAVPTCAITAIGRSGAASGPRAFERAAIDALGIAAIPVGEVEADAIEAATRALARMEGRCDRLLVHFDVDVIDFTDMPLSENWGRNEGLPFATAMDALGALPSGSRRRSPAR